MTTTFKIEDHHVISFTRNVELLLQQKQSRFAGTTGGAAYVGREAQVVKQFSEVDFVDFNAGMAAGQWKGETVWSDIEHHQRWVFPSDKVLSLPYSPKDGLRMVTDPRSPYAEAMRAAHARRMDDFVINAATADAKTGQFEDLQNTPFPASQIIADGGTGLTIDKLIEAKEKLIAADNDPSEERYFAVSERQLSNLLKTTQVTNADYNTVKALVRGEIDTFVGFKFISSERLLSTGNIRHCFAWVKSGLHVGTWEGLTTEIDRRPDRNYVWQIWMTFTAGATRTQEKKIVQVNCAE